MSENKIDMRTASSVNRSNMADEEDERSTHKRKSHLTPSTKKKRARTSREKYLSKRPFIGDDNAKKWHELKGHRTDAEFA